MKTGSIAGIEPAQVRVPQSDSFVVPSPIDATMTKPALSLSLEKLLEHAVHTGELRLSARNLKGFPILASKFKLKDTVETGKTRGSPANSSNDFL